MYTLKKIQNGVTARIGSFETIDRLLSGAVGYVRNHAGEAYILTAEDAEDDELYDVCRLAVETFSETENNAVAVEELSELQKEICKRMRGAENDDHMAEEIADAEIVIEKLKIRYVLYERVDTWKRRKLDRLCRKIEGRA